MNKLLDDAKAAGFHISGDDAFIIVYEPCNNVNITKELIKFAALQIPEGYKLVPIEFNISVKALLFNQKYGSLSCQKRVVKLCICNGCITDRLEAMLAASPPINTEVT